MAVIISQCFQFTSFMNLPCVLALLLVLGPFFFSSPSKYNIYGLRIHLRDLIPIYYSRGAPEDEESICGVKESGRVKAH